MVEEWLWNLKEACDAGYFKTEVAKSQQTGFPWQNKRCGDCPFWMNNWCQVDLGQCSSDEPPCRFSDPPDYVEARRIIEQRLQIAWQKRWQRNL